MPSAAEVYRSAPPGEALSSGDIAFLSLPRTRFAGEMPPGEQFDPIGRIPAYPSPAVMGLPHGLEVALDTMFAMVVTHSCEIDRQQNRGAAPDHFDCRITVAPIVSEHAVTLVGDGGEPIPFDGWPAIERNDPVSSIYLPPADDLSLFSPDTMAPWPRAYADLRGLTTVSRRMIEAERLMGVTPAYLGVIQRQLARFFTWRDLAQHHLLESAVGRRLAAVVPLEVKGGRWRAAITFDDGSSITAELRDP